MTTGIAEGAHIKVNSSFHTLTGQHSFSTKGGVGGLPKFLDEFGKTCDEVSSVFMESFDVFFVFVCRVDDGSLGEIVQVGAVGFIALTGYN